MSTARDANLLGALVVALDDQLTAATEAATRHGAASPAALVSIRWQPALSIEELRQKLGLSHSGTVRLLDRLEEEGTIERAAGKDGRSVALALTARGRRQAGALLEARREALGAALGLLSPAEQRRLVPLVEKLLTGLTRSPRAADQICRLCDEAACPSDRCPVECAVRR